MLFYKVGPNPEKWWGMLITSEDDGRTWSVPRRLPDGILGPIKNKPVQLGPKGGLLCPTSTEDGGWRVHFERTDDSGKTWRRIGPVSAQGIDAIQPTILRHSDGRLQAIGRTRQGRLFTVESVDGGDSWGAMSLLDLPNPNSGVDAVTLADGRHLLVYNHAGLGKGKWDAGREVLNVAVSTDGKVWQAALVLEKEPGQEFSYPAVIQTADGLVHITYTWKRKRIRHVVLDPGLLHVVIGRAFRRAVGIARLRQLVVDEHDAVADEHAIADVHARADERVRRDLAVRADRRVALDLDERTDARVRADLATVEIDELVDRGALAEDDVGRDRLEPLGHARIMPHNIERC